MKRGILVLLSLSVLAAVAYFTASKWAIRHETIVFHDPDRNNRLVAVHIAVRRDKETQANAGTSVGIAADDLPHVFDRYWQKRRSGGEPGVGLGLAIVRGIVDAHGGHLAVESTPGKGSQFSFTIPTATQPEMNER